MRLELSPAMLRFIIREINGGRPLFALLRGAEYVEPETELWKALQKKAHQAFVAEAYDSVRELLPKVLRGVCLKDFSAAERLSLYSIRERSSARHFRFVLARKAQSGRFNSLRSSISLS